MSLICELADSFALNDLSCLKPIPGCEYVSVFSPVALCGGYRFVHGPTLQPFGGALYCAFAYNEGAENSASEQLLFTWSLDKGDTWSAPKPLVKNEPGRAHSHGALFVHDQRLYCAAPEFGGLGEPLYTKAGDKLIRFTGLMTRIYRLNDEENRWVCQPCVIPDFWPLGAPQKTAAGLLVMPGCDGNWLGSVAECAAGDFPAFRHRALPLNGEAYSEAALLALKNDVCVVMRNQTKPGPNGLFAAVCASADGGVTFSPAHEANLPLNASKPCCGRLSDGRPFIVFNYDAQNPFTRRRLLLGVGKSGGITFDRFYLLDEDDREKWLCYPDACVDADTLYVVYSAQSAGAQAKGEPRRNHNDVRLARIPQSAV